MYNSGTTLSFEYVNFNIYLFHFYNKCFSINRIDFAIDRLACSTQVTKVTAVWKVLLYVFCNPKIVDKIWKYCNWIRIHMFISSHIDNPVHPGGMGVVRGD